jgi:hypothetical protein
MVQALASPLGEALQCVEGGLDEDTVLMLFLLWEKGRGKESPWHPFLSAVRHKKVVPAKKKTAAAAATKKKSTAATRKAKAAPTKPTGEEVMAVVEKPSVDGGGGEDQDEDKLDGEWAAEVDLPLAWSKEERGLLGADFDTVSQLGYVLRIESTTSLLLIQRTDITPHATHAHAGRQRRA